MANDPAFLFYPGDYLKDTQCLSEKSQVAYDRIMCEHMRNICISQEQLNFFIKRLTDDEKNEVLFLLKKIKGGYQISWVAESICKRRSYSESRAENRKGKVKNISKSCVSHMEIENEIENEVKIKDELTDFEISKTIEFVKITGQKNFSSDQVKEFWNGFKIISENEFYNSEAKKIDHFRNWLKKQNNGEDKKSNSKYSKTAGIDLAISSYLQKPNDG